MCNKTAPQFEPFNSNEIQIVVYAQVHLHIDKFLYIFNFNDKSLFVAPIFKPRTRFLLTDINGWTVSVIYNTIIWKISGLKLFVCKILVLKNFRTLR